MNQSVPLTPKGQVFLFLVLTLYASQEILGKPSQTKEIAGKNECSLFVGSSCDIVCFFFREGNSRLSQSIFFLRFEDMV